MSIHAFQSITCYNENLDLAQCHPTPREATILWDTFCHRVNPLLKILFDWEIDRMREISNLPLEIRRLTPQENAYYFAIYLNSFTSLSEEECLASFSRPKSELQHNYQLLYEQAIARSNFIGRPDIILIQASIVYIVSSFGLVISQMFMRLNSCIVGMYRSIKCTKSRLARRHSHSPCGTHGSSPRRKDIESFTLRNRKKKTYLVAAAAPGCGCSYEVWILTSYPYGRLGYRASIEYRGS